MADKKKIKSQCLYFMFQCALIYPMLTYVGEKIGEHYGMRELLHAPLNMSGIFCAATGVLIAKVWQWIAINNEEMLTTFYSATNAFRMLLALATLTVCYFIVGSEQIKTYVIVFLIFYFIAIIHHAIYFARITNNK